MGSVITFSSFKKHVDRLVGKRFPWWEVLLVSGLMLLVVRQLLFFPVTEDPDPDGYVSYARQLQHFGQLPDLHQRFQDIHFLLP